MEVITKEKVDERDGSKILKLIQHFCPHGVEGDQISLFVDFHLKMLYSAHKNKKAPAYMLKSILISLDKVDFDRLNENYKKKALDVLKLLKPNCYEIMIEIFKLQHEIEFFTSLAELKLQ